MSAYQEAAKITAQIDRWIEHKSVTAIEDDIEVLEVLNYLRTIETHCTTISQGIVVTRLRDGG